MGCLKNWNDFVAGIAGFMIGLRLNAIRYGSKDVMNQTDR